MLWSITYPLKARVDMDPLILRAFMILLLGKLIYVPVSVCITAVDFIAFPILFADTRCYSCVFSNARATLDVSVHKFLF